MGGACASFSNTRIVESSKRAKHDEEWRPCYSSNSGANNKTAKKKRKESKQKKKTKKHGKKALRITMTPIVGRHCPVNKSPRGMQRRCPAAAALQ